MLLLVSTVAPAITYTQPLYLLGDVYDPLARGAIQRYHSLVRSLPWFTYRNHFPEIERSGYTTDMGWGCVLRTGQMILGHSLINILLGRDFLVDTAAAANPQQFERYRQILRLFGDHPSCPFSVHRICRIGISLGKHVGEWYDLSSMCRVIKYVAARFLSLSGALMFFCG